MSKQVKKSAKSRTPSTKAPRAFANIGQYLKHCRDQLDISQKMIAKQVGYKSPQILSNIERGKQRIPGSKMGKFVKAYKADAKEIFTILVEANRQQLAADLGIKKI